MKTTTTDKTNTTQVSDTNGKDDEGINEDEIEWNIHYIEQMTNMEHKPTRWIPKHNIQQIYHTIIKGMGQTKPRKTPS